MTRILLCGSLLLLFGCAVPAERMPIGPLPENGQVLPYSQLLTRVRFQANRANEAFYLDQWNELEDMAKGIDQTARFLAKAEDVPKQNKASLVEVTADLGKSALKLKDAAARHDVKATTETLQQINLKVRQLRLTEESSDRPKEATPPKAK